MKNVFSKNYFVDASVISDISSDICTAMANADGVIQEASGVIREIIALEAGVPAKAQCGALTSACAAALNGIRNIDFVSYGHRVRASMTELCDYSDFANQHLVGSMQMNSKRLNDIVAGTRSLAMLTKYSKTENDNKEIDSKVEKIIYNKPEDYREIKMTPKCKAAILAGIGVNKNGDPIINNGRDSEKFNDCLNDLYEGKCTNQDIAIAASGVQVSESGIVSFNNYTDSKKYMEVMAALNSGPKLSCDGIKMLKKLELAQYQLEDVGVYKDKDHLIGIKPYYVLQRVGNMYEDDGGITIGFGHHVSKAEWDDKMEEYKLLQKYVPEDIEITGKKIKPEDLPVSGVIIASDQMVPICEVNKIFRKDIETNSKKIADFLLDRNIEVSQNEFDALVIYRFTKGSLPKTGRTDLKNKNRNEEDWKKIWTGGNNRKDGCQELFFNGEYYGKEEDI